MAPTTRAQRHRNSQSDSSTKSNPDHPNPHVSSQDLRSVEMEAEEGDTDDCIVQSPTTKLRYDISGLPSDAQSRVEDAFREPPQIALHHCRLRDGVYAFQMTELVPHSIRIGHPGGRHSVPSCSCAAESNSNKPLGDVDPATRGEMGVKSPCRHLLWLLDHVAKQTTAYEHNQNEPLTLNTKGYAEEIGDPFQEISRFHLDVLADSLHCNVVPDPSTPSPTFDNSRDHDTGSNSDDDEGDDDEDHEEEEEEESKIPSPLRVLEAREVLSSVAEVPVEDWRIDLSAPPRWRGKGSRGRKHGSLIRRGDLEATLFRMLISNDNLFHSFLSQLPERKPVNDPFRKLGQRVDRVVADLEAYSAALLTSSASGTSSSFTAPTILPPVPQPMTSSQTGAKVDELSETPNTVEWAAGHLQGIVRIIDTAIFTRDEPIKDWEQTSAVQTLVHLLGAVINRNKEFHPGNSSRDRNLFSRLIGDSPPGQGEDFVIYQLSLLPTACSMFLDPLQDMLVKLVDHKAYPRYIDKVKDLIARCKGGSRRASTVAASQSGSSARAGSKRRSQTIERDPKRQRHPR
ncbi:putative SWIM zinc finger protein [Zalerion maritima]|uniref:SWIM zinc finger protein n=1 Tax=Zalerion maritima TaxID=339359 RepID=A0AAD5RYW0_9PEZI|nr:putative SWIM zinc finger protein [Zalerion maritima]